MKNKSVYLMLSLSLILLCVTIGTFLLRRHHNVLWTNATLSLSTETPSEQNPAINDGRININIASAEELSFLPQIGTKLAIRIVQYRIKNGLFTTPEDILNVEGITQNKYNAFSKYITTN